MSKTKLDIDDFVYISVICEATSVRSSVGLKYQLQSVTKFHAESSATSNTLWACVIFLGKSLYKDILFCVHSGALDLIYAGTGTSLYEHILWMYLEKIGSTHAHFQHNARKLISLKSVSTIRSSSRKLSNEKVMTTACNVWRQIACSFWVKRGNVLLLSKIFEIPPFFQTRPGYLGKKEYACLLRFSALKSQVGGNLLSQIAKMADRSFADRVVLPVTAAIYRNGEEKPVMRE